MTEVSKKLSLQPQIELVTRQECHLCSDAIKVLDKVTTEMDMEWKELPIDEGSEIATAYAEEIPALIINGKLRDFWALSESRVRKILTNASEQQNNQN